MPIAVGIASLFAGCHSCQWPVSSSLEESLRDVRERAKREAAERAKLPIPEPPPPQLALDPLYFAARMGKEEIIKLFSLSKEDLDINKSRWFGQTLLHAAIDGGDPEVVEVLLRLGADPAIKDQKGDTGVHAAARSGNLTILTHMLEKLSQQKKKRLLSTPNFFGETPLHLAVRFGVSEVINLLLQHGSVVTFRVTNGGTAWHKAAEEGVVASIRTLAAWDKTYVDVQDHLGHTPLHVAAAGGAVPVIEELKLQGAELESRDSLGYTALHLACNNNQQDAVVALLQLGANPNAQDARDRTPLHVVAQYGWVDLVSHLLQWGADPRIQDIHGKTPLDLARRFQHKKTAAVLRKASSHGKGVSP